jgi:hypothetical protein
VLKEFLQESAECVENRWALRKDCNWHAAAEVPGGAGFYLAICNLHTHGPFYNAVRSTSFYTTTILETCFFAIGKCK